MISLKNQRLPRYFSKLVIDFFCFRQNVFFRIIGIFLKNLILNEWANGTRVITLDPEAEYLALTRNLSGNIIDVGNAKEGRINPFHIYKILTEEGTPADPVVTFNTHLKMLESFLRLCLSVLLPTL